MAIYNKVISARWTARLCIVSIMMLTLFSFTASSQNNRRARRAAKAAAEMQADSAAAPVISDSLRAVMDSTFRADSIAAEDSVKLLKKSSLQAPAFTTAKDSIIEDFSNGKKTIYELNDVDPRYWFAGRTINIEKAISIPADASGKCTLYLNLPDPKPTLHDNPRFSIRLANDGIWNDDLGYNKVMEFNL